MAFLALKTFKKQREALKNIDGGKAGVRSFILVQLKPIPKDEKVSTPLPSPQIKENPPRRENRS